MCAHLLRLRLPHFLPLGRARISFGVLTVRQVAISHGDVRFYEEVRVWLAKLDAQDRIARGELIPDDVKRLLGDILVTSTESEGVIDIHDRAGVVRPRLNQLTTSECR